VREGIPLHPRETGIQLVLEVRDDQHAKQIISLTQQIN
jgi:type III secretory pathway component EscU